MDSETEQGIFARQNALLRFYYRGVPEKWSDDKWCKRVAELDFVLLKIGVLTKKDEQ